MKIYIDLQDNAITKIVTKDDAYEGDIFSNVFELMFFNYADQLWFPTMSQLAPNNREAGDFEADALGSGETHEIVEDNVTYLKYNFTLSDGWVLMKGRSNFFVWVNRTRPTTRKCVGKVNVMINESTNSFFIQSPYFNPVVKGYIDGEVNAAINTYKEGVDVKIEEQNTNISGLLGGSPRVVDTEEHILVLTSNQGVAVATDTGKWYYWNGTQYTDGGVYQAVALADGSVTTSKINNNAVTPIKTSYLHNQFTIVNQYDQSREPYIEENISNKNIYFHFNSLKIHTRIPYNKTISFSDFVTELGVTLVTSPNGVENCIEINSLYCLIYNIDNNVYQIINRSALNTTNCIELLSNAYGRVLPSSYFGLQTLRSITNNINNDVTLINNKYKTQIYVADNKQPYIEQTNVSNVYINFNKIAVRPGTVTKTISDLANDLGITLVTSPNGVENCIELGNGYDLVFDYVNNTFGIISRNDVTKNHLIILENMGGFVVGGEWVFYVAYNYYKTLSDEINYIELSQAIKTKENDLFNRLLGIMTNKSASFGFITDLHNYGNIDKVIKSISNINDKLNLDLLVMGGDYLSNTSSTTKDVALNQYDKLRNEFNKYKSLYTLPLVGNHDLNSMGDFDNIITYNEFSNLMLKQLKNKIEYGDNLYGYYDIPRAKLRVIFLNSVNMPLIEDEDTGKAYYPPQYDYCYGKEQLEWFANIALNTPDDYHILIIQHNPYTPTVNSGNVKDYEIMQGILNARLNKTTYVNTNLWSDVFLAKDTQGGDLWRTYSYQCNFNLDYSNANDVELVGCIYGHTHTNKYQVIDGVNYYSQENVNAINYSVITVNTDTKTVNISFLDNTIDSDINYNY